MGLSLMSEELKPINPELEKALKEFAEKILAESEPMPDWAQKVLDENFWELLS